MIGTPDATVEELLREGRARMQAAGCDECALHAELLLSRVLGIPRAHLSARHDRRVPAPAASAYLALVERRGRREPLQYILGETEFLGLRFLVTPAVLIPRPETELLVERAAELLNAGGGADVLDIGTGSGNIAVGIAALVTHARLTAVDISPDALRVAEQNAAVHCPGRIRFVMADMRRRLPFGREFDLVVSNPPYIAAGEVESLAPEIREHEPRAATTDGEDGLSLIRAAARAAGEILRPGGTLLVEIGFGQSEAAAAAARETGFTGVILRRDYAGIERILEARLP